MVVVQFRRFSTVTIFVLKRTVGGARSGGALTAQPVVRSARPNASAAATRTRSPTGTRDYQSNADGDGCCGAEATGEAVQDCRMFDCLHSQQHFWSKKPAEAGSGKPYLELYHTPLYGELHQAGASARSSPRSMRSRRASMPQVGAHRGHSMRLKMALQKAVEANTSMTIHAINPAQEFS